MVVPRLPAEILGSTAGNSAAQAATEPFRRSVYRRHCDGINASAISY